MRIFLILILALSLLWSPVYAAPNENAAWSKATMTDAVGFAAVTSVLDTDSEKLTNSTPTQALNFQSGPPEPLPAIYAQHPWFVSCSYRQANRAHGLSPPSRRGA